MSCEIIQFSAAARPARKVTAAAEGTAIGDGVLTPRQLRRAGKPELPPPATETCKNQRLRKARREVWRAASTLTFYWRSRLDWHSALGFAQSRGIADANRFPPADNESRHSLVDTWRAALAKQLLTPAPDIGAVAWKRAQLRAENYRYSDVKPERIGHAIADNVAFLEAHPTRRSVAASRQSSRPEQEQ